ncbi:hypothetical protein DMH12_03090 [Streptomyces sp. WAC 04229]|uniref:hypothetical protein n=1 Tax=Streptomyces sp. WAC 04229 TaxID=2203206 RepID=UPI000F7482B4|nr:hypothetical protein [Streptomyces sp. WAC 04229]RSN64470.1 hypothetical protein DMH12_03090 [Streptomyces sp. WAC 04229]
MALGRPYDQFEKRRASARAAGRQPDPREAHMARLCELNQRLTGKFARTHDEVQRLRRGLSTFPAPGPEQGQGDNAMGVIPLPRP